MFPINNDLSNTTNNLNNSSDFINELQKSLESFSFVIDRFEGDFAICEKIESKELFSILRSKLPTNSHEGDILTFKNNSYYFDLEKKSEIENRIKNKMDSLWN